MRILIADDNRGFQALMRSMLGKAGHETAVAASADEAMRRLDGGGTDMVFLDYRLRDPGRLETLTKIKEQYPETDMIAVLPPGSAPSAAEAIKHGAIDYLSKPIDAGILNRILKHVEKRRRLEMENRKLKKTLEHLIQIEAIGTPADFTGNGASFAPSPTNTKNRTIPGNLPLLTLRELESAAIARTLDATGGDKSRAARILGINRSTLYRKLQRKILKFHDPSRDEIGADSGPPPKTRTANSGAI